uniref:Uncharacterized protein n=1 Tax=Bos indicus x Bos taurus TaxID=30522 RepID=A0A4W2D5R1_BOBOX
MGDVSTKCAYQKQPTNFQNKKRVLLGESGKEKKRPLTGNIQGTIVTWRLPSLHPKVHLLPEMPPEHVSLPFPLLPGHLDRGLCHSGQVRVPCTCKGQ